MLLVIVLMTSFPAAAAPSGIAATMQGVVVYLDGVLVEGDVAELARR